MAVATIQPAAVTRSARTMCRHCTQWVNTGNIKRHIKEVHGIGKDKMSIYSCENCHYQTGRKGDMRRHHHRRHRNQPQQGIFQVGGPSSTLAPAAVEPSTPSEELPLPPPMVAVVANSFPPEDSMEPAASVPPIVNLTVPVETAFQGRLPRPFPRYPVEASPLAAKLEAMELSAKESPLAGVHFDPECAPDLTAEPPELPAPQTAPLKSADAQREALKLQQESQEPLPCDPRSKLNMVAIGALVATMDSPNGMTLIKQFFGRRGLSLHTAEELRDMRRKAWQRGKAKGEIQLDIGAAKPKVTSAWEEAHKQPTTPTKEVKDPMWQTMPQQLTVAGKVVSFDVRMRVEDVEVKPKEEVIELD